MGKKFLIIGTSGLWSQVTDLHKSAPLEKQGRKRQVQLMISSVACTAGMIVLMSMMLVSTLSDSIKCHRVLCTSYLEGGSGS